MRMPDLKEATLILDELSSLVTNRCSIAKSIENFGAPHQKELTEKCHPRLRKDYYNLLIVSSMIVKKLQPQCRRLFRDSPQSYYEFMLAFNRGQIALAQVAEVLPGFGKAEKSETPDEKNAPRFIIQDMPPSTYTPASTSGPPSGAG
ncbi:hypothetical protein [Tardiphaga sp.]|uniref:hypothetical protein n=1 Tax=Tardiphaga sp. TaxID=1926292 RepID=UPI0026014BF5|nr:hypothetical protein [Tardiphaga sp.]